MLFSIWGKSLIYVIDHIFACNSLPCDTIAAPNSSISSPWYFHLTWDVALREYKTGSMFGWAGSTLLGSFKEP